MDFEIFNNLFTIFSIERLKKKKYENNFRSIYKFIKFFSVKITSLKKFMYFY